MTCTKDPLSKETTSTKIHPGLFLKLCFEFRLVNIRGSHILLIIITRRPTRATCPSPNVAHKQKYFIFTLCTYYFKLKSIQDFFLNCVLKIRLFYYLGESHSVKGEKQESTVIFVIFQLRSKWRHSKLLRGLINGCPNKL